MNEFDVALAISDRWLGAVLSTTAATNVSRAFPSRSSLKTAHVKVPSQYMSHMQFVQPRLTLD
jgi:hypothetical protein